MIEKLCPSLWLVLELLCVLLCNVMWNVMSCVHRCYRKSRTRLSKYLSIHSSPLLPSHNLQPTCSFCPALFLIQHIQNSCDCHYTPSVHLVNQSQHSPHLNLILPNPPSPPALVTGRTKPAKWQISCFTSKSATHLAGTSLVSWAVSSPAAIKVKQVRRSQSWLTELWVQVA